MNAAEKIAAAEPAGLIPLPRVLVVDDEPFILNAMKRVFRGKGYELVTAESGPAALELLENEPVDLVISDMRMPEMDGVQFLEQVVARWPACKRLVLTGYVDVALTIAAINGGKIWGYIAKPWNDEELLITVQQALDHSSLAHENARLTELTRLQNDELKIMNVDLEQKVVARTNELQLANTELRQSFLATVQVFSNLVELHEGRFAGHSRRVADFARQMAERLGLDDTEQRNVLLAGLLHDIGKVGLSEKLTERPFNALSPIDKATLMRHPVKGQQLLLGIPQLAQAARIIRHHHEFLDGSGYPDQLVGLAIPLGARILAVANDYDELQTGALAMHQYSPKEAQDAIVKLRGKRYDPTVIDAFLALLAETSATKESEVAVAAAELKAGMVLARDLKLQDQALPLAKGRVVDAAMIAGLLRLQVAGHEPITLHIRRNSLPAVLRDGAEPTVRSFKELALPIARLKEGMMLSRSLHHHEGYLLLARGNFLDEPIIRQLRDIETSSGKAITLHIRMGDR